MKHSDSNIKSMSEKVISTANPTENQDLTTLSWCQSLKLAPSGSFQPLHTVNTGDAAINHALKRHCFVTVKAQLAPAVYVLTLKKETLWLFFFEQEF